jgi:hypothetical protein
MAQDGLASGIIKALTGAVQLRTTAYGGWLQKDFAPSFVGDVRASQRGIVY